jgi:hypothetical protein
MLDSKLQLKDGQTIACVGEPVDLALAAQRVDLADADAVLLTVRNHEQLREELLVLSEATAKGKLTWVAYPKARQLDTDLNRDLVRELVVAHGLDTVRQVALNDVWSTLRLKPLAS